MYRLHNNAFEILRDEIEICTTNDKEGKQKKAIALKRLQELRVKSGQRVKLNELRDAVVDVFPMFSEAVLKNAAKANRKPSIFRKFKYLTIALVTASGAVTILNLPHPKIRWFIARTAPVLLIPSNMNMDFHYWSARSSIKEAESLLKSASDFDDIKKVEEKTEETEQHLSSIPVWFLGYYPEVYCQRFRCGWNFTFEEFENIRTEMTKVETKIFKEKNAFVPLVEAQQAYNGAKRELSIAKTQRQKDLAIASMEAAIKTVEQVPLETLARKKAEVKLKSYKRYYEKVAQNN